MTKIRKETSRDPDASPMDPEVIQFRAEFEERSPLDQLVREGAQKMLQSAIDAEVHDFLSMPRDRRDEQGKRLVVGNGHLPFRELSLIHI